MDVLAGDVFFYPLKCSEAFPLIWVGKAPLSDVLFHVPISILC